GGLGDGETGPSRLAPLAVLPAVLGDQGFHSVPDVVANAPDGVHVLALRVLQRPVSLLEAGNDRTALAAAHGDEEARSGRQLSSEEHGLGPREVDPDLLHRLQDLRVDARARFGTRRAGA